ncbi:MAG: hypothetical protein KDC10_04350 [Calditrichaeota bacterium]|nr:hypothetical protein [Candidatus Cloacimonadota bacterium]MCA9787321.1 hypothetical protein [Candidatus Cloacimonadota bacterium]MCB1046412.1 hypothetical protein [Calditrichota bacterium]MCB9472731.1 hypothetical protein [Candidatus Delongbacteria bacterium]
MTGARLLRIASAIVLVILLLVLARSLGVLPSPAEQRLLRLDELRVSHLEGLVVAIDAYWNDHGRLPDSLRVLAEDPRASLELVDPMHGTDYGYRILDESRYRLCATFSTASPEPDPGRRTRRTWLHPQGEFCWELDVHPAARRIP